MSATFRERFESLVETLRADAGVVVLSAELSPPASAAAIKKAERAAQRALPASMRAFYEAHNGAFLVWGLAGRKYPKVKRFQFPDDDAPPGCINLLPIEKAMSPTWQRESLLNEVDEDCWRALFGRRYESFSRSATKLALAAKGLDPEQVENDSSSRVFEESLQRFDARRVPDAVMLDIFSKSDVAALLLGPVVGRPADGSDEGPYRAEEPLVIVAGDDGSEMSSNGMSFDTYLECMLSSYGAGRPGFSVEEDPKRVKSWKKKPRALKSVLAALDKEDDDSDD